MKKLTPFQEGYTAFHEGNLDNPYNQDTSRARDWQFGFNKAYYNNLGYVKKREATDGKTKKKAYSNRG